MDFLRLDGQTAVVTGAATGIGEAIATRLAQAGATVAIADRDEAGAADTASRIGFGAFGVACDVTSEASVQSAMQAVAERAGKIDILVNNAGVAGRTAPVWEVGLEEFQQVIGVNLVGVFLCTRAVVWGMRERKYGRIVNIASVAGKEGNSTLR